MQPSSAARFFCFLDQLVAFLNGELAFFTETPGNFPEGLNVIFMILPRGVARDEFGDAATGGVDGRAGWCLGTNILAVLNAIIVAVRS